MENPPENTSAERLEWIKSEMDRVLRDLFRLRHELSELQRMIEPHATFNPEDVCRLIREEMARGRQPASLVLGQREAREYRALLDTPHTESMRENFFFGLEVVEDTAATKMALVGDKGAWDG